MIEETAVVTGLQGPFAWVESQRKSSCSACAANKGCGTAVISKVLGNKRARMKVINDQAVKPGDVVVIGIEEGSLVRGSLMMYALPLLLMFISASLGFALFHLADEAYSDGWQILFSFAGLGGGFVWLRYFTNSRNLDPRYQPVILRKMEPTVGFAVPSNTLS